VANDPLSVPLDRDPEPAAAGFGADLRSGRRPHMRAFGRRWARTWRRSGRAAAGRGAGCGSS